MTAFHEYASAAPHSLSVGVYRFSVVSGWQGKVVTEKYNHAFIEKVNIGQMQTSSSLEIIAQDYGWK